MKIAASCRSRGWSGVTIAKLSKTAGSYPSGSYPAGGYPAGSYLAGRAGAGGQRGDAAAGSDHPGRS
jgi:hypothetical protein